MNTFERALQEMARELLPNVSSEDDKKILSQLKKLYRIDREGFHQKLKRINVVRKSEGLEPLHPNEIIGKELKSNIKGQLEKKKKEEKEGERIEKQRVVSFLPKHDKIPNEVLEKLGGKNEIDKAKEKMGENHYLRAYKINFKDGEKAYMLFKISKGVDRIGKDEILKVTSDTPYKIGEKNKVLFPEKGLKFIYYLDVFLNRKLRKL